MTHEMPLHPGPPGYRPTSRALVVDDRSRLLLVLIVDPQTRDGRFWMTPGGGVDPGESFEAGALRELWEETGIVAPLGPCVWSRRRIVHYGGRIYDFDERFYMVRVDGSAVSVSRDNVTEWERIVLADQRWWTLDELLVTDEVLAPRGLAQLVAPILAGTIPPEPLILDE
ncbi:MAG: NUDIX domain-containing protein [Chloroflexota bacterium]